MAQLLLWEAAWLRRDAIASYDYHFSAEQFDDIVAFEIDSAFYKKTNIYFVF